MIEFWRAGGGSDSTYPEAAAAAEAEGWDGQMFMDSQSLGRDPYVLMGAWAMTTQRIKLSTGVTNPLTRHPAVTAGAAATVHAISGGRAVLGIGRGDSALAYLGRSPARLAMFEKTLADLQALLSGGEIDFTAPYKGEAAGSINELSLGEKPKTSRLHWLPTGLPKVPLDVAATGPKVIEMSAVMAERVTFSVGAMPDRIDWAIDVAQAARRTHGLSDEGVSFGAQIIVLCYADMDQAMEYAASAVPPLARFQVIQGETVGPAGGSDADNLSTVGSSYDMTKHGKIQGGNKLVGAALTPDFIRRFAIVGPPDHCIERLLELVRCGLERFVVVGPGFYPEPEGHRGSLFVREVMPAVRSAAIR
jgi:5,10-methylenetetrahydromethanopterin reductase